MLLDVPLSQFTLVSTPSHNVHRVRIYRDDTYWDSRLRTRHRVQELNLSFKWIEDQTLE